MSASSRWGYIQINLEDMSDTLASALEFAEVQASGRNFFKVVSIFSVDAEGNVATVYNTTAFHDYLDELEEQRRSEDDFGIDANAEHRLTTNQLVSTRRISY